MKKLLFSLTILLAVALSIYFSQSKNLEENSSIDPISPTHKEIFSRLHRDWLEGVDLNDPHLRESCSELIVEKDEVAQELRGCRTVLFRCFYENRLMKIKVGKKYVPYRVVFESSKGSQSARWSLPISILFMGKSNKFYLKNNCHRKSLPLYYYNHGRVINQDNTWHPGDVSYWIDKFLVRNVDIVEWVRKYDLKDIKLTLSRPFAPAVNLTASQMKRFCNYHDGVVLSSRVADAVTYYSTQNMTDGLINRNLSPYPFSPRKAESPHFSLRRDGNNEVTENDCAKIETRDCRGKGWHAKVSETLGWSGVGELLGGPLEYVENQFYGRYNLILSSYYFDALSPVHRAGERGFWDGRGFSIENFKFLMSHSIEDEKLDVAFRCMGIND